MAAAVTVTPTEVQVGDLIAVTGTGFLPNTLCTVSIPEQGISSEITSDPSGTVSSDDLADLAVGTLTSDGTNVAATETVVVGSVTYTFRASVTTTANEVKVGADAATSLANLKHAINADGTTSVYGSATVVNPTVAAGALTTTTLQLYAKTGGTGGNSLASTETSAHLSFGGTTLAGGAAATGISPLLVTPEHPDRFTVSITDGTSTATARVAVFTQ